MMSGTGGDATMHQGSAVSPTAVCHHSVHGQPPSSRQFDWMFVGLSAWLTSGFFLDGWAHTHGKVDGSFFTSWHAALYTGYLALAVFLVGYTIHRVAHGIPWRQALPVGYGLSLLGAVLFWCGGLGDMLWHFFFGIEANVEALLSPTHLLLAVAAWLILGGPLRAAWHRVDNPDGGYWQLFPMLLSMTFMLSTATFITQIAHPVANLWGGGQAPPAQFAWLYQQTGVVSFLWDAGLVMGSVFVMMRRWVLPPGALTLLITLNAVGMGFLLYNKPFPLVPVVARMVAAMIVELLYILSKPSVQRPLALRLFAFVVPALLTAMHFLALQMTQGIWWTIHLWTGIIVLSGIVGVLASYVLVAPKFP